MSATLIIENKRIPEDRLLEWGASDFAEPWKAQIAAFLKCWYDDRDYVEVNTSGSTGTPKTIRLSKSNMEKSAILTGRTFDLDAGANALLCLPAQYIAGQMMIVRALVNGWILHCAEASSRPLEHIDSQIDFCAMIPMQMAESLKQDFEKTKNIGTVILGGAPVSNVLRNQLHDLPNKVFLTYGMTETVTHVAIEDLKVKDALFHALSGVRFELDSRNCLVISADHLDGPDTITNDVVELMDDSKFRWLGRYDDVINSGGIKLHPALLEKKISDILPHPFYFSQRPDEKLGQALVLVIEGPEDAISPDHLRALIEDRLDKFEVPKDIIWKPLFKRTQTGKIIKEL